MGNFYSLVTLGPLAPQSRRMYRLLVLVGNSTWNRAVRACMWTNWTDDRVCTKAIRKSLGNFLLIRSFTNIKWAPAMLEIPGTQVQRSMCSCAGLIRSDHPNVKFRGENHGKTHAGNYGNDGEGRAASWSKSRRRPSCFLALKVQEPGSPRRTDGWSP